MATNAAFQSGQPGAEPSMEEILASIRRIIADDSLGTKKDETPAYVAPPAPAAKVEPEDDADADVLDLAEVAAVTPPPAAPASPPAPLDDAMMVGLEEEPIGVDVDFGSMPEPVMVTVDPPAPAIPVPVMMPQTPPAKPLTTTHAMEDHILSRETGGLVANAFAALSRNTAMPAAGRSLEDVVAELLRPMLRDWMDSNLPAIVERLVKVEIERVSRGG